MAELGIPTVRVWEVDETQQTALLDYIEGLPVNLLLEQSSRSGFLPADRDKIEKHFVDFKRWVLPLWPTFKASGVIMDLKTGEFVVVDPI